MAIKLYLLNGTNPISDVQDTEPAANVTNTEWRFATSSSTVQSGHRAKVSFTNIVGPNSWDATTEPDAPAFSSGVWRTPAYTGTIPAGDWLLRMRIRSSGTTNCPSQRVRFRVFKGSAADGSDATEITSGALLASDTGTVSSGVTATSDITWSAPAITLNGERLFISAAIEARANLGTTNGSNTRQGAFVREANSFIEFPDLTTAGPVEYAGMVAI